EDRLHLRREDEPLVEPREIERLYPETVPRGDEQASRPVVEQERELAPQLLQERQPVLLVEIDDDLGVALRLEVITLGFERASDPLEIVNLAVGDQDDAAVVAFERLGTSSRIDDGQPVV